MRAWRRPLVWGEREKRRAGWGVHLANRGKLRTLRACLADLWFLSVCGSSRRR